MNMRWLDNLVSIRQGKKNTICPVCGAQNVQYKETVIDNRSGRGYADIWCDECMSAFHISRGVFDVPIATSEVIPRGLKY